MQVCRSAGYFKHALDVALAAEHSDTYLDILIEDCKQWDEALAYLLTEPRKNAALALQKYGKVSKEPLAAYDSTSNLGIYCC